MVADLLVVIGSSLRVAPVCEIVNMLPPDVPAILINRETAGWPNDFDIEV